jgi:hypothetical protein
LRFTELSVVIKQLKEMRLTQVGAASRSMAIENRLTKFFERWPAALIILGAVLTVVWLALLIWFSARLLLHVM